MKYILFLALFSLQAQAANYISLASGNQLYDVEVIVFDRNLPQRNSFEISKKPELDLSELNAMWPADPEWPLIKSFTVESEDEQWQVPLNEAGSNQEALAWFAFDLPAEGNPVFQKINRHPQMNALFYQKWRQPATPYRRPGFIKISNWSEDLIPPPAEETEVSEATVVGNLYDSEPVGDFDVSPPAKYDGTFRGKVAFSKQRFHHAHININLHKAAADGEMLIHNMEQNSQIDLGQWQYYDHQQFGVMIKVSVVNWSTETEEQTP